jgi:hypothetical protein
VANNAVAAALVGDTAFVYSFAGIDSTKVWSGIHLKSWRLNTQTNTWQALPPVPDPAGGKIAAAASTVKGKIYVIGGYHVAQNGSELSSSKVHCFDPAANVWLPDAAPLPRAIDDQVQAVWRDSLIFVITGWSNTQNVADVQVFNPTTNTWASGTPVPNTNNFKAFGASGLIVGDSIYYCGGASGGGNFPASSFFRKGYINPDNPVEVTWSGAAEPLAKGYRMAAALMNGRPVWLGGSDVTYNYNGIAYNGSGGVAALPRVKTYDAESGQLAQWIDAAQFPAVMDLRGAAQWGDAASEAITVGGMGPQQKVTAKTYRWHWAELVATPPVAPEGPFVHFSPNPFKDTVRVRAERRVRLRLLDANGALVANTEGQGEWDWHLGELPNGVYFAEIWADGLRRSAQQLQKNR